MSDKFASSKKGLRHAKTVSRKGEAKVTKAGRKSNPQQQQKPVAKVEKIEPALAWEIDRYIPKVKEEKAVTPEVEQELYNIFMKGR